MPKVKPDNVIRHEIVLGRADRELLDTAVTAYTANRVLTPITDMLSSTPGLLLLAGIALSYGEKYLPENWSDMDDTQLADWFETENIVLGTIGAGAGGLLGAILGVGNPFAVGAGAAAGGLFGSAIQESAEEAQAGGVPKVLSYSAFGQIVAIARMSKSIIEELS